MNFFYILPCSIAIIINLIILRSVLLNKIQNDSYVEWPTIIFFLLICLFLLITSFRGFKKENIISNKLFSLKIIMGILMFIIGLIGVLSSILGIFSLYIGWY
jgi:uncharacterized oligopeptide transporter (OPT) family protein